MEEILKEILIFLIKILAHPIVVLLVFGSLLGAIKSDVMPLLMMFLMFVYLFILQIADVIDLVPVNIEITSEVAMQRVLLHRKSPPVDYEMYDRWESQLSDCRFDSPTHCVGEVPVYPSNDHADLMIQTSYECNELDLQVKVNDKAAKISYSPWPDSWIYPTEHHSHVLGKCRYGISWEE